MSLNHSEILAVEVTSNAHGPVNVRNSFQVYAFTFFQVEELVESWLRWSTWKVQCEINSTTKSGKNFQFVVEPFSMSTGAVFFLLALINPWKASPSEVERSSDLWFKAISVMWIWRRKDGTQREKVGELSCHRNNSPAFVSIIIFKSDPPFSSSELALALWSKWPPTTHKIFVSIWLKQIAEL